MITVHVPLYIKVIKNNLQQHYLTIHYQQMIFTLIEYTF